VSYYETTPTYQGAPCRHGHTERYANRSCAECTRERARMKRKRLAAARRAERSREVDIEIDCKTLEAGLANP
jgi:hypothetical protein